VTSDPSAAAEPRWLNEQELAAWRPFSGLMLKLLSALDAQLQRDADLSFFGYLVLAGLSEAPGRTRRMSELAVLSNGSLSRLSHAVATLERRGYVQRCPSPENGRITLATLTDAGYAKLVATAPGHVEAVRSLVLDVLSESQFQQLGQLATRILESDPDACG
jgi:DNA-binding MarR family transcriptional regulator